MTKTYTFKSKQLIEKLNKIKDSIKNEGLISQEISERTGINREALKKYTLHLKNTKQIYICDYQLNGNSSAPVYRAGNKEDCKKVTDRSLLKKVKVKNFTFHKPKDDFVTSWIPRRNLKNEAYING